MTMSTIVAPPVEEIGRGWRLTTTGLVVSKDLTLEEWIAVGKKLAALSNSVNWAIGDWVIYGEHRNTDWGATDRFAEAQHALNRSYDAVLQAANVSRAFPPESRRFVNLSWSCYREALRLPRDRRLVELAHADGEQMSKRTFGVYVDVVQARLLEVNAERLTAFPRDRDAALPARVKETKTMKRLIKCPRCGHSWQTKHGEGA